MIDFGDLCFSNVVCEPAIAAAYATMGLPDPVAGIARLLAGYHTAWPLAAAELEVVHALVCLRLCVSVTNSAYQATVEPENRYLTISEPRAWELLETLSAVEPRLALYKYRAHGPPQPADALATPSAGPGPMRWSRRPGLPGLEFVQSGV